MHTVRRAAPILLIALFALPLAGCDLGRWLAYVFAPVATQKTVPAEFSKLEGKRVAVIVFTDEATQVDYPFARLTLSQQIAEALKANVDDIQVVDTQRVIRYQEENVRWDEYDRTRICKDLGADYLLYVSVLEFSTLEPGSTSLYRGRITAEPTVYDATKIERSASVWRGGEMRVVYPENSPGRIEDDRSVRYAAEHLLAERLAKKFYKHKEAAE